MGARDKLRTITVVHVDNEKALLIRKPSRGLMRSMALNGRSRQRRRLGRWKKINCQSVIGIQG